MTHIRSLPLDDTDCGWFHISPPRPPRPAHQGRSRAPWVVVGAGLTGLATARQLARHFPNDEIILVEAQIVGYGPSGRNSGFAIDIPHDLGSSDYIGDPKAAKTILNTNRRAQAELIRLAKTHKIDCQIAHVGKYQLAVEPHGVQVLKAYKQGLAKINEECIELSKDELPEHIGIDYYNHGLFMPTTVLLQPATLVKGLADSLPSNVTLYENTAITELSPGKPITLKHENGEIITDRLILTNNAFATQFGFLKDRILPIFTYASLTRPLSEDEQAALGGKPEWGIIPADPFGTTLRRTRDQRLLIRNGFSFNPNGAIDHSYLKKVKEQHRLAYERRFPMLKHIPFEYTWGGAMGMTRNHSSFFGQLTQNVYAAVACNGLGITRGTGLGMNLADWLSGIDNEEIRFLLANKGPNWNPPEPFLSWGVNRSLRSGEKKSGLEI